MEEIRSKSFVIISNKFWRTRSAGSVGHCGYQVRVAERGTQGSWRGTRWRRRGKSYTNMIKSRMHNYPNISQAYAQKENRMLLHAYISIGITTDIPTLAGSQHYCNKLHSSEWHTKSCEVVLLSEARSPRALASASLLAWRDLDMNSSLRFSWCLLHRKKRVDFLSDMVYIAGDWLFLHSLILS